LVKTEGNVLRTVRYGETRVIVQVFTAQFGIQSYLVNGVRSSRSRSARANILQPANMLEMVVYYSAQKKLQRISEFKLAFIYQNLYSNVVKNAIALYIVELLHKSLSEPEPNPELYFFSARSLQWLDQRPVVELSNLPLCFTLKAAGLLGFELDGKYSEHTPYFDLKEGEFVPEKSNDFTLGKEETRYTSQLLKIKDFGSLPVLKIPAKTRAYLLSAYLIFLKLHLPGFRELRSPKILKDILH